MMAFNYHRTHGRSYTHHLEVAACSLTNVSTCSDASGYGLRRFLLNGCDDTTTDLKTTNITALHIHEITVVTFPLYLIHFVLLVSNHNHLFDEYNYHQSYTLLL